MQTAVMLNCAKNMIKTMLKHAWRAWWKLLVLSFKHAFCALRDKGHLNLLDVLISALTISRVVNFLMAYASLLLVNSGTESKPLWLYSGSQHAIIVPPQPLG